MRFRLGWKGSALLCLALLATGGQAAAPPTAVHKGDRPGDVAALAARIDRHITATLTAQKAVAAPPASDGEFARRVYLDLGGRIPRVSEVRAFLDDTRPDKRARLVEKLLAGANYINHFTNTYRALLLPNNNNPQVQFFSTQIEAWVRTRIRDNVPYDKMVRELLTTNLRGTRAAFQGVTPTDQGAYAYFQANEMKAENIAAATSRLFLGVKIECAQCHDHPFAKWSRKQFWEYTAFFAGIKQQNPEAGVFGGAIDDPKVREIAIGDTGKKAKARFLDDTEPEWQAEDRSRTVLAEWMTKGDNPFFARAAANRMWEHFFGIGLVDPVDDFREENPASHPALVDDLARALVENKFDMQFLIRAITASKTYQRTSQLDDKSQYDLRLFARVPIKGMSPEQIFDSLATAVGYRGDARGNQFNGFGQANTPRGEILSRFTNPVDRRTEYQTSILQALALMNGKFVADATSLTGSETLAAVIDAPFMNTREKLDTLFLSAFARPMRGSEAGKLIAYVEGGGPTKDTKRAYADIVWVLLNSSEFILNH